MLDPLNGDELRRWAAQCAASAESTAWPRTERERLMRIKESLLALADNADWLEGKTATTPPVQPQRAAAPVTMTQIAAE